MNNFISTRHGATRMRQRGMKNGDVALILAHATQVDNETWMLLERDANHAIKNRKQELQALERLVSHRHWTCSWKKLRGRATASNAPGPMPSVMGTIAGWKRHWRGRRS